jgi:hypothetical protein
MVSFTSGGVAVDDVTIQTNANGQIETKQPLKTYDNTTETFLEGDETQYNTDSLTYVEVMTLTIANSIKNALFGAVFSNQGGESYKHYTAYKVYKNGVIWKEDTALNEQNEFVSEVMDLTAGDVFSIEMKTLAGAGGYTAEVKEVGIYGKHSFI